ncbi:hypothetical protein VP01_3097g2 [Puccinia sorghi]|uniref:Uncharacterized protein n=1 Tax=Puccinia sorghi TaxID=27349 RepID=A0A0L6V1C7_9BASI|nr:hypothetical protein VP01_3097g2 [Puccinia sorghi]
MSGVLQVNRAQEYPDGRNGQEQWFSMILRELMRAPPLQGTSVKVLIKFSLFIPGKKKQGKKMWVGVSDNTDITINYGMSAFQDFQEQVASACNFALPNTGPIIMKSVLLNTPTIKWQATIARTPRFLKKDQFYIQVHSDYLDWLGTGKSNVSLTLSMPKPSKATKWAAKEDLLAAHAAALKAAMNNHSAKQKTIMINNDKEGTEDEEIDVIDWERINTHIKKIYEKNLTNMNYNQHLPVYINPSKPHCYILIILEACQEWACALVSHYFASHFSVIRDSLFLYKQMARTKGVTPTPLPLAPYPSSLLKELSKQRSITWPLRILIVAMAPAQ